MRLDIRIDDSGSYTELAKAAATVYDSNGYVVTVLYCDVGPGATSPSITVDIPEGGRVDLVQAFPPMVVDEDQMAAVPGEWPENPAAAKTKKLAVAAEPKHADHGKDVGKTPTPTTTPTTRLGEPTRK